PPSLPPRRHPPPTACDDWRPPPESRNGSLPQHVPRLAPLERNAALGRMSLPCRTSKLGPVFGRKRNSRDQRNEQREEHSLNHEKRCFATIVTKCFATE